MYRRLLRFARPHAWRMGATIVCNVVAAALDVFSLSLLVPLLTVLFQQNVGMGNSGLNRTLQEVVSRFVDIRDKLGAITVVMFVIFAAVILKNLFVWIGGQLGAALQEGVTRDLRDVLYAHLTRLPIGYFTRTKGGQILSRVLQDTQQTKQLITQLVTQSLQSSALVVFYLIAMFKVSWRLSLIALVSAPLLIGSLQPLLRKLRKGYRRLSNDFGEMASVLQETIAGIRLVKSFGAEAYEERRFTEASGRYADRLMRVTRVSFLSQPLTETTGTVLAMLVLWVGARQVVGGTLRPAELIAFLVFVTRMLQPLKAISQIPAAGQASLAAAERLFEVLDMSTETARDRGTITAPRFDRDVVFEHVGFSYEQEPVLADVSLTARKGEVVALVGASGAGKSTLVDLIPRFYEPQQGRILLDGVDVREIRLGALRTLTGIVSQDTVLFNDSVRHNIAYGEPGRFTEAQIEAAARAANAHGFVQQLPQGYDTILGERGTVLSGGQRQRIAIARALLVDPPILILDEATSALDTESERLVQEAIDRLLAGRTVFVIAHRLSTVEHATQILVLDHGRIVERGTHAELLARRGAYHRLYSLQFRDRESAA